MDDDSATLTMPSEATDPETSGDSLDGSETTTEGTAEDSGSGTSGTGEEGSTGIGTGDSSGTGETGPMGCAVAMNEGMCDAMEGCLWIGAMGDGVCTPIDEVECGDVTDVEACAVLPDCVWSADTETCDPE